MGADPVAILTHEFYPYKGGIAVYVEELAKAGSKLGFPVEVWAPENSAIEKAAFPFAVRQIPMRGKQDWGCRLKLAAAVFNRRKFLRECTVCLPEPGSLLTFFYLQKLGIFWKRLVVVLHGSDILYFTRKSSPHRRWLFGQLLHFVPLR